MWRCPTCDEDNEDFVDKCGFCDVTPSEDVEESDSSDPTYPCLNDMILCVTLAIHERGGGYQPYLYYSHILTSEEMAKDFKVYSTLDEARKRGGQEMFDYLVENGYIGLSNEST